MWQCTTITTHCSFPLKWRRYCRLLVLNRQIENYGKYLPDIKSEYRQIYIIFNNEGRCYLLHEFVGGAGLCSGSSLAVHQWDRGFESRSRRFMCIWFSVHARFCRFFCGYSGILHSKLTLDLGSLLKISFIVSLLGTMNQVGFPWWKPNKVKL